MNFAAYMVAKREEGAKPSLLMIDTTHKWSSAYIRSIMAFKRREGETYTVDYLITDHDKIDRKVSSLALMLAERDHGQAESWPVFTNPRDLYAHLDYR